ncbi:MAG: DUF309 domain-containing protein [Desulfurococcales archaeon]|nr:DUF309 domain-containing protein [Desulfurococcales archaeon]
MERVAVRARNRGGLKPGDAWRLKSWILSLGEARSVNVRVAPRHIEIDMVASKDVVRRLEEELGPLEPLTGGDPWNLAKSQRFWEAHEELEEEWRLTKDPGLEAVIKAMAALAKAQEGRLDAALRIVSRIPQGLGVDRRCVEEMAARAYQGLEADILKCIGGARWRDSEGSGRHPT